MLLEGNDKDLTVGRSYRDAPEIDGLVLVPEVVEPHRLVTVEMRPYPRPRRTHRLVRRTRRLLQGCFR